MASFTEQATLKIQDEATGQISRINAALRNLRKTAASLKSQRINFNVNDSAIAKAAAGVKHLASDLKSVRSTRINVSANVSAAQRQINALRQQAGRPVSMAVNARGQRNFGGAAGGITQNLSSTAISGIGHAVAHAVAQATREGVNDSDIGKTSLALKQLSPEQMTASRQAITQLGKDKAALPGGTLYNTGQRTKLFSEALGVTNNNVEAATALTSGMEELTRSAVAMGQSFRDAEEGAISYGKAAEMMGRTTFHEGPQKGQFDEAGLKKTFEYFQKIQPDIGREMTGSFTRQIAKYLGPARFAMSDRALGAVLMMGEEEGTRAAVGWRQATKQLSGQGVKKAQLENLKQAGLITTEEKHKGTSGGRKETTSAVKDVKDRELLQKDLPKYVAEKIAPLAAKYNLDVTKPGDAVALAQKFASDTTAVETIAALLYRSQEIQQKLDTADKRSGDVEMIRRITQGSVRTTLTGLENQLQGVMGEGVMALAPVLTPALQSISTGMQSISETIKAASQGDKHAQAKLDTGMLAAAALAPFARMAASPAMQAVSALAKPIGMVSGVQAMLSADPATRALGAAGESLLGAASELSGAASALAASALVGKDKSTLGQVISTLEQIPAAGQIIKVGHILINAAEANLDKPEPLTADELRRGELIRAQRALTAEIEKRNLLDRSTEAIKGTPTDMRQIADARTALTARISELTATVARLSAPVAAAKPPSWLDDVVRTIKQAPTMPTSPVGDTKWGDPAKTSSATDVVQAASSLQTTTSAFSTSFLDGTARLQSTSSSFSEVFTTGAVSIGNSGSQIVSTLQSGAGGIGAIIGNEAVAAIRAGVSGLTVNVNANVSQSGGDKGNINNANGNK